MKSKISQKEASKEEKLQKHLQKLKQIKEEYLRNLAVLKINDSIKKPSTIPESDISVKKVTELEILEALNTTDPHKTCYAGILHSCEICNGNLSLFYKDLGGSYLKYRLGCGACYLIYDELFYQRD